MYVIRRNENNGEYVEYVKKFKHTWIFDSVSWTDDINEALHECKGVMENYMDRIRGSNLAQYNLELMKHSKSKNGN